MLSKNKSWIVALLLCLSIPQLGMAQAARQRTTQPAAVAGAESDSGVARGLRARMFEVKHRNPETLLGAIQNLGSGAKGSAMSYNNQFRTISVRDFPENLAVIEEALKRLDQPAPPAPPPVPTPDIEFQIHILLASPESAGAEELPATLTPVITELKSTLKYKSYSLMASAIHRAKTGMPGASNVNNSGVADAKRLGIETPAGNHVFFQYDLENVSVDSSAQGDPRVQVRALRFSLRLPLVVGVIGGGSGAASTSIQYHNVGFSTPMSLRDGERVVVGTTTVQDKGLALVVSARLIK